MLLSCYFLFCLFVTFYPHVNVFVILHFLLLPQGKTLHAYLNWSKKQFEVNEICFSAKVCNMYTYQNYYHDKDPGMYPQGRPVRPRSHLNFQIPPPYSNQGGLILPLHRRGRTKKFPVVTSLLKPGLIMEPAWHLQKT